jgi:hypothetical protein
LLSYFDRQQPIFRQALLASSIELYHNVGLSMMCYKVSQKTSPLMVKALI